MERQIGQAERQHHDVGCCTERPETRDRQQQRGQRTERKNDVSDQLRRTLQEQPGNTKRDPEQN